MYLYSNSAIFFILAIEIVITAAFIIIQKIGYYKLVKESNNIGSTNDEKMKNIRKISKNVYNVDNFVDKHVNNYEFCGLKLYTIQRICGNLLNFLFITWSIVTVYGVYLESSIKDILWTVMLGILIVGGLFSVGCGVDNYRLEEIAKINIRDYIENVLQIRKRKEEIAEIRQSKVKKGSINELKTVVDCGDVGVVAKSIEDELIDNIENNSLVDTMKLKSLKPDTKKDNLGYLSDYMDKKGNGGEKSKDRVINNNGFSDLYMRDYFNTNNEFESNRKNLNNDMSNSMNNMRNSLNRNIENDTDKNFDRNIDRNVDRNFENRRSRNLNLLNEEDKQDIINGLYNQYFA